MDSVGQKFSVVCKSTTEDGQTATQSVKGNSCPLGATRVK